MARELEQTHRLEAVGQLAAGMAHEINTPIQYVGDNVQFAGDGFESLDEYLEAVDKVLQPQQRQPELRILQHPVRPAGRVHLCHGLLPSTNRSA